MPRRAIVAALGLGLAGSACAPDPAEAEATSIPGGASPRTWLIDRTEDAGLTFVHRRVSDHCEGHDSMDGPGVCAFDADSDGDVDVFLPNRAGSPSALFLNDAGRLRDVAEEAGVAASGDAIGCLAFDYDADGDEDLLVTGIGRSALYRNDGGHFDDATAATQLDLPGYATTASAGDVDGDGDLDLVVARLADLASCEDSCTSLPINCTTMERNLLFINDEGVFREEGEQRGLVEADPSLAALLVDVDQDGDLDLYIGNDRGYDFPDRSYVNDGGGHFVERGAALGLDAPGSDTMGVAVGDVDGDGRFDLAVTDFSFRPTLLFYGAPDGGYRASALSPESASWVKWAVLFADLDLDGHQDLFQTGGDATRVDGPGSANQLYRGDGDGGLSFVDAAGALDEAAMFRGAALVDYDDDGDADLVVTENGGRARLFENVAPAPDAERLTLSLGTLAAGSTVRVSSDAGEQRFPIVLGSGYLGSHDPRVFVGADPDARVTVSPLRGTTQRRPRP